MIQTSNMSMENGYFEVSQKKFLSLMTLFSIAAHLFLDKSGISAHFCFFWEKNPEIVSCFKQTTNIGMKTISQ